MMFIIEKSSVSIRELWETLDPASVKNRNASSDQ